MAEERKIVSAYIVKRFDNGDIDVEDAKLEGTTPLGNEDIYKDIEDVSKTISLKRMENAAFAGVYRFYADLEARAQAAAQQAAAEGPAEPTLEK